MGREGPLRKLLDGIGEKIAAGEEAAGEAERLRQAEIPPASS